MFSLPDCAYSIVTAFSADKLPLVAFSTKEVAVTVDATVTVVPEMETPVTASFRARVGVPVISSPNWLSTLEL